MQNYFKIVQINIQFFINLFYTTIVEHCDSTGVLLFVKILYILYLYLVS